MRKKVDKGVGVSVVMVSDVCSQYTHSHQIHEVSILLRIHTSPQSFYRNRLWGWGQEASVSLYLWPHKTNFKTSVKTVSTIEGLPQCWQFLTLQLFWYQIRWLELLSVSRFAKCECVNDWFWEVGSVLWFGRAVPLLLGCGSSSPVNTCMLSCTSVSLSLSHTQTHTHTHT